MYREDLQELAPKNVASFASLNRYSNTIMIETIFYRLRLITNLFSTIKIIKDFRTFTKLLIFIRSVYGNWIPVFLNSIGFVACQNIV